MKKTNISKYPSTVQKDNGKRKAGIRKKSVRASALANKKKSYKPKMTVPVGKSFEELQEMNEKALIIIAKRI
ncbi:hypothetical protein ABC382_00850 [Lysinibacillus sp. 1P01SD]|uniref:hypothetical protein n=1 Tax=Lysinibacillus sp. 1P01SD TaxID=3132285 RepID=UPI00399FCE9E